MYNYHINVDTQTLLLNLNFSLKVRITLRQACFRKTAGIMAEHNLKICLSGNKRQDWLKLSMEKLRGNPNHPKKGSAIKTQPIRRLEDIRAIKRFLAGDPRNLAIFTLGINSALRGSDLLRLRIEDVQSLKPGDSFEIREQKTRKYRRVMLNKVSHRAVQDWIQSVKSWDDGDWLFPSRKGKGRLSVPTLTAMVKSWCRAINLTENYGSHTLRKTFGYQQRVTFGLGTAELMWIFNHSSERQTLDYLGIEHEEIRNIHWNAL